jgi:hypothetical protein
MRRRCVRIGLTWCYVSDLLPKRIAHLTWRMVLFYGHLCYFEEEAEHILLLSMDHIVTDFWSMTVLARELLALYEANKTGKPIDLPSQPRDIPIMSAGRRRCWRVRRGENWRPIGK